MHCDAAQRSDLEQLRRYITRPAFANEWLSVNRAGQVVLKLKTPYRNDTTHIVMSPMEFIQRVTTLVPHAKLRSKVAPAPEQATTAGAGDYKHVHARSAPVRMSWARLLKRVFDINFERGVCGGNGSDCGAIGFTPHPN